MAYTRRINCRAGAVIPATYVPTCRPTRLQYKCSGASYRNSTGRENASYTIIVIFFTVHFAKSRHTWARRFLDTKFIGIPVSKATVVARKDTTLCFCHVLTFTRFFTALSFKATTTPYWWVETGSVAGLPNDEIARRICWRTALT